MTPQLRQSLDSHRATRQAELYELADLLERERLTPDAGPIRLAATSCLGKPRAAGTDAPDAGREYWGYQIDGLHMSLEAQRHCRPRNAQVENMTGILSVTVQEYVPESCEHVGDSFAQLRNLSVDFRCDAIIEIDGTDHSLRSAWHIDTHLFTDTHSALVHPRFHYQVGGEGLDDLDHHIRGVLMPEAPRMACAPFDGVLAVDLILSQYCGSMWDDLRVMESRYGRLRQPAMDRYWAPYYSLIAQALGAGQPVPLGSDAGVLMPNLAIN